MYYSRTASEVFTKIIEVYPNAGPDENRDDDSLENYILWMTEKVMQMNRDSLEDALKAARWVGWILCMVEEKLGLWDNNFSRDLVRDDVINGRHLPFTH